MERIRPPSASASSTMSTARSTPKQNPYSSASKTSIKIFRRKGERLNGEKVFWLHPFHLSPLPHFTPLKYCCPPLSFRSASDDAATLRAGGHRQPRARLSILVPCQLDISRRPRNSSLIQPDDAQRLRARSRKTHRQDNVSRL